MKQITQFFSEGESLTLNIVTLLFDIDWLLIKNRNLFFGVFLFSFFAR